MDFETDVDSGRSFVVAARWPDGSSIERAFVNGNAIFLRSPFLRPYYSCFRIEPDGMVSAVVRTRDPDPPSVLKRLLWFLAVSAPPFRDDFRLWEPMLVQSKVPCQPSSEPDGEGRYHAVFPTDTTEKILAENRDGDIASDLGNELYQLLDEAHPFWRPVEDFREWAIEYFPGENWREG